MVHGGPGGQAMTYYDPLIQYLVNHGYAVLDVNNRGSGGYGKTKSPRWTTGITATRT